MGVLGLEIPKEGLPIFGGWGGDQKKGQNGPGNTPQKPGNFPLKGPILFTPKEIKPWEKGLKTGHFFWKTPPPNSVY